MPDTRKHDEHERGDPVTLGYAVQGRKRERTPLALTIVLVLAVLGGLFLALLRATEIRPLTREQRNLVICMANLRGIGAGVQDYADELGACFPPDLETLVEKDRFGDARMLVSRFTGHQPPNCDYYYVTSLTPDDPASWIIAYVDPAYCDGQKGCILRMDGHVDCFAEPQLSQEIARFKAAYEQARGQPPVIIPPH